MVPEGSVDPLLAQIAGLVPGSASSPNSADMLMETFLPAQRKDGIPVFERMLKPLSGEVHFLFFWRAFSKASQTQGQAIEKAIANGAGYCQRRDLEKKGLGMELYTLHIPESDAELYHQQTSRLHQVVSRTIAMSVAPEFWNVAKLVLNDLDEELTLHQLTTLFISWLHDAIAWQHREVIPAPPLPQAEFKAKTDNCSRRTRRKASSLGCITSKRRAVNCQLRHENRLSTVFLSIFIFMT